MSTTLLAGCLLFAEAPQEPCESSEDCWPFACGEDRECLTYCSDAGDCVDGLECFYGSCEELCVDDECAGHLKCEKSSNECRTDCFVDRNCRDSWKCCLTTDQMDGVCPKTYRCYNPDN